MADDSDGIKMRESSESSEESVLNFLDNISNFFSRMLFGIPRFVFGKFPVWIYKVFKRCLPLLSRLLKLLILVFIWVSVVLWPFYLIEVLWSLGINSQKVIPSFIDNKNIYWISFSYLWAILCFCGSLWGIVYVVKKLNFNFHLSTFKKRDQETS